jgi:hypothetical protein
MDLASYILSALLISSNTTTLAGMHEAGSRVRCAATLTAYKVTFGANLLTFFGIILIYSLLTTKLMVVRWELNA